MGKDLKEIGVIVRDWTDSDKDSQVQLTCDQTWARQALLKLHGYGNFIAKQHLTP